MLEFEFPANKKIQKSAVKTRMISSEAMLIL